jgi:hypothetical protein
MYGTPKNVMPASARAPPTAITATVIPPEDSSVGAAVGTTLSVGRPVGRLVHGSQ